ncbi:hypothetical protein L3X38_036835 [Prunus dulcis]|uniref:Uncharacterized protein n=1 Tax=Prunus dulcis TaxID=3755 RepID=A0AAD4V3C4_PRUDU|nr:hypothetical protein L3X38_036835 [Prunus dulcis]
MEEKLPEKACYEMPTKKMSSHLKPLDMGAHFDGVLMSKVLVDTWATAAVEDTFRRQYSFWAERATEHGSTANLVEFLHKGSEDDALKLKEVELVPSEMDDSKVEVQDPLVEINLGMEDNHQPIYIRSNGARTSGQDGRLLRE